MHVPTSERATSNDISGLETHLGYWLRAVSNHVSQAFQNRVEQHGVTVAEWVVMRALFDVDAAKPSDLAANLGLTRSAISKLVDRLAAKDLVTVDSDPQDGRGQQLSLRPAGRRLVPKLATLADANDAEAFGHLDPRQRAELLTTFRAIATQLGIRGSPLE
jgi:DNA-binding MarR family transcriptional regulator